MPAKKQITKDMILKAAFKLLKQQGYQAVTIKKLAKELKCSTQPIYLSFTGMDALRHELIALAIEEFKKTMQVENQQNTIHLYGIEYVQFARKNPNLFYFLFMRSHAFDETKQMLTPIIEQSINEFMDLYHISHDEADHLHDHLWMHSHGIASMIVTDFCDWDLEKVNFMIDNCKKIFIKEYEA